MEVEVVLPQFGIGMHEATVVQWLHGEGDRVVEGDPIVEVEAEKAVVNVVAPVTGVLVRRVAAEDDVVSVKGVLGIIDARAA